MELPQSCAPKAMDMITTYISRLPRPKSLSAWLAKFCIFLDKLYIQFKEKKLCQIRNACLANIDLPALNGEAVNEICLATRAEFDWKSYWAQLLVFSAVQIILVMATRGTDMPITIFLLIVHTNLLRDQRLMTFPHDSYVCIVFMYVLYYITGVCHPGGYYCDYLAGTLSLPLAWKSGAGSRSSNESQWIEQNDRVPEKWFQ